MPPDLSRYHRQMLLPGIGPEGQARLADAHALVVGVGALGTVAAEALARAGVGRLTLVDRDVVEWTNLQRQTLYEESDARDGAPKASAAARRLSRINAQVRVEALVKDFTPALARELVHAAGSAGCQDRPGVILDCTDNFETRFLVNDVSVWSGVPSVYAGAVGTQGMSRAIVPGRTPCLRCLFDGPPPTGSAPTCDTAGVLGPAAGIAALLQAGEALKLLLGRADLLRAGLVTLDLWNPGPSALRVIDAGERDPDCPCCAKREFDWLESRAAPAAVRLCGRNAVQIAGLSACVADEDDEGGPASDAAAPDLARIGARLRAHGEVLQAASLVRCTLTHDRADDGTPVEITVFADGRTVVRGTQDAARARSLVARYVGA